MSTITTASAIKSSIDEVAIFGGSPLFAEALHVGRPNIGNRQTFATLVDEILDRRWLTNAGECVREFERRLADFLGVKHCIAMCNATVGLDITMRALELQGEVIVPSFTFIATAHALKWQQLDPVFCDIDAATHNIDPRRVEELITPRTTGILGVHVWGRACDIEALAEIAQRHKLRVLFDAAHAFACSYKGQMIGGFGDVEVFSFHATKFFNTFEGGAVTTNNDELAKKIRLMKNFGFSGWDQVSYLGTNGKMSEISAAMGLTSLESLAEFIDANRRNYQQYQASLNAVPHVRLVDFDDNQKLNYQYVVIEVDEEAPVTRDQLMKILHAENVMARRYFYPGCHRMEPYRTLYPDAGLTLPVTECLGRRVLVLPTGTAVGAEEISAICELVRFIISNGSEVNERFSAIK